MTKIEKEKQAVSFMIELYCKKNHYGKELCNECTALNDYAVKRLEKCRYGDEKTSCNVCQTHCYKADMREKIRQVMRFSGPRLILHHPIIAVRHLLETIKRRKKSS